jgi:phosphoglycerate kinase
MSNPTFIKFNRLTDLVAKHQIKSKRVFIRADLNVPQDITGKITEDTRLKLPYRVLKRV